MAIGHWIAQRTRSDLATAVSFLAHRVQELTMQDRRKLGRLLTYAKYTKDKCLHLRPTSMQLEVYIDASHAIYTDRRGHARRESRVWRAL